MSVRSWPYRLFLAILAVTSQVLCIVPAAAQADAWTDAAPMLNARAYSPAVEVGGRIYVFTDGVHQATERFDPATGAWTTLAPTPSRRAYFATAVVGTRVYLLGGCFNSDCRIGVTNLVEVYDTATDTWSSAPPMPTPRWGAAAGAIDGRVYVAGGGSPCPFCYPQNAVLEILDTATNAWTTGAPLPMPREEIGSVVLGGKLYAITGFGRTAGSCCTYLSPGSDYNAMDVYDPSTNAWSFAPAPPTDGSFTSAAVADGRIHLVGMRHTPSSTVDTTHWVFDPALGTWSARAPMNASRTGHALAAVGSRLYSIGGTTPTGTRLTVVEEYGASPPDTSAPVTTASVSPAANTAGWHSSDVAVTLSASDVGTSGVASIAYTLLNNGASTGGTIAGGSGVVPVTLQGTTVISFAATDNAGNVEASQSVTVRIDKTPPTLALPETMSVDATSPAGAVVIYTATASDNLDPAPRIACFPPPGGTFPIATSSVTCTSTDVAGNSAMGSFLVQVVGAEGQILALIARVRGAGLSLVATTALVAELQVALYKLRLGFGDLSCLAMKVFNETARLLALKGQLSSDLATDFIVRGNRIRAVMGCA